MRRRVTLRAGDRTLELGERPRLMGIVNASPDSFSDGGATATPAARVQLGRALVREGAEMLDVGGESARTDRAAVEVEKEIERVVPLVRALAGELDAIISVDTYKPPVAAAAIDAGAVMVNDVSGLRDPELARLCARTGAALVIMHTRAAPKQRLQDPDLYGEVTEEVCAFLRARIELALSEGVRFEQLIVDPGPDFAKTPAQTIELLRGLESLHELGRPILLAISRKDFIGALTGRPPRERTAGTLAALAHGVSAGAHILRLHEVAPAADFLAVQSALDGSLRPSPQLALSEVLRHDDGGP
ncbi:MAG: dihydropteroate synthase [Solirubrobacterales bacterium]|nr:dihydropteroate synthase [Solirubrobacterales bacterium]